MTYRPMNGTQRVKRHYENLDCIMLCIDMRFDESQH